MRNIPDKIVDRTKTYIFLLNKFFFPPENRTGYEIMWIKEVRSDWSLIIIIIIIQYGAFALHSG